MVMALRVTISNLRFATMRAKTILTILLILGGCHTTVGQYYFGRNKIQYNTFRWQVMKTPHFDIYFYPEMRELAEIGAAFAEESYRDLENRFNHNVDRRIPLIFYSSQAHFQETNVIPYLIPENVGGFFEFLKGRVVVPYNGSIAGFKRAIQHELVHVFTYSKIEQIMKDHRRLNWTVPPLWFIEGIAEYWSGGWDSQAEMVLRDAVLNDYLVPLSQMYQISGSFLMYKEGQAVLKYISETYGEGKILQLVENLWKRDRFQDVFKLTLGKDYRQFDEEWIYHLKKSKYPLLKEGDIPKMVTERITHVGINTKPAFYKEGKHPRVVFVSNRLGYSDIYQKSLRDKKAKPEVLIKGERTSEFEAFHILRSKIDVNPQGMLAFTSKSGQGDVLYIYDINRRKILARYSFEGLVSLSSPCWSPDNREIALSGISFSGKNDIYIVNLADGSLRKLTNDFYDDRDPTWSPDGRWIAFSSDRTDYGPQGFYNLFLLEVETGEIHYLTYGKHHDYAPSWSPDGRYIAFCSDRDGAFNIWVIKAGKRARGKTLQLAQSDPEAIGNPWEYTFFDLDELLEPPQLKKITNFVTGAFDPEWTDEGALLFTAFENFEFQIRRLKDVMRRFEEAPIAELDRIEWKGPFWAVKRQDAEFASSTIKYKRKFDLDIAQSAVIQDPILGTTGGAQLAISDMLGDHRYHFIIYNNARTKDEFFKNFNIAVTKIDLSRRMNYAVGIYHFAGRYFNYYDQFFYERRYGGFVAGSYPFSTFKRVEASFNIRNSDKEWYGWRRKALLLSNFFSFVKDNSLWGPTGPIDGERFNITLGNTVDIKHSNVNFYTIMVDYRRYFRLSRRITYALRLMGRFNEGKETQRFYMGGSWDLRGYERWSIWGEKLVLINNEIRFPFIDKFAIRFPFGGLGLSSIRGAAFLDLGNAWNGRPKDLLGSFGLGIRFRVGGVLVLRFDYGRQFTLGIDKFPPSLQVKRDAFKQFFFGWDY